jgi:hypothetical protein
LCRAKFLRILARETANAPLAKFTLASTPLNHGLAFPIFPFGGTRGKTAGRKPPRELGSGVDGQAEPLCMRLILRIVGTWLVGVAVILIVIDGTRSLAASRLVTSTLGETWGVVSAGSLDGLRGFIDTRFFGPVLDPLLTALLGYPGFLVLGIPGILLIIAGRPKSASPFVRQDQF